MAEFQIPMNTPISELKMQMFQSQAAYKPFHYPWAEEFEERQQSVHWLPREQPMGEDLKDWAIESERLTPEERAFLTNIFRLFTQSDIDVQDNYVNQLMGIFKNGEINRMLTVIASFETVHIKAYSYVLESLKLPDSIYHDFMNHQAMRDKHDWLKQYKTETLHDLLIRLAVFSSFVEGLQLFASFAMLLNFPRFGLMRGMGQIVTWSIRDETIHLEAGQKLYHTLRMEAGIPAEALAPELQAAARHFVMLEDAFIDEVFKMGAPRGMNAQDTKNYVRYMADLRLEQLQVNPIYDIKENPLPWTDEQTGHEHTNFFENRSTEYSKAAHTGSWEDAFAGLDMHASRLNDSDGIIDRPSDTVLKRMTDAGLLEPVLL